MHDRVDRRRMLELSGATIAAALAGCSGGSGDGADGGGEPAPDAIDEFLTSSPEADNYDGTIVDLTGRDEVTVEVGASGNGGAFAFAPPAFRVSVTTTVSWQWTGEGGRHNVASVEDSAFDFDSGDPKISGDPFEQSFDDTGIGLYVCDPHENLGMKGGFEVVE